MKYQNYIYIFTFFIILKVYVNYDNLKNLLKFYVLLFLIS